MSEDHGEINVLCWVDEARSQATATSYLLRTVGVQMVTFAIAIRSGGAGKLRLFVSYAECSFYVCWRLLALFPYSE